MRDDVNLYPSQQGTGSIREVQGTSDFEEQDESSLAGKVGQAVMIVSGAALVAFAAKRRSWSTLGAALAGAPLVYRGTTGHWPAPRQMARRASEALATKPVETSVTVGKPAAELYSFWRDLENLPRFMKNLDSVTNLDDRRSHWVAKSPLGFKVEWDAEIVEEREGQLLSWRSLPGAQVHNAGTVLFEPATGGRGTVVRVTLEYRAAGLGQAVARVLRPITEQEVREDLRRFKNLMEAGEVPTTEGQPAGARHLLNLRNPL